MCKTSYVSVSGKGRTENPKYKFSLNKRAAADPKQETTKHFLLAQCCHPVGIQEYCINKHTFNLIPTKCSITQQMLQSFYYS